MDILKTELYNTKLINSKISLFNSIQEEKILIIQDNPLFS